MNKCTLCIPTYHRVNTLNCLLASVVGAKDDRIDELLLAISYEREESIDETTEHLLRALEINGVDCTVVDGIDGFLAAKRWFKETARNEILLMVDDDAVITRDYLNLLDDFEKDVAAVNGSLQTPLDIGYYKKYSYDSIPNPPEGTVCNRIEFKDGDVVLHDKYQVFMLHDPAKYECECLVGTAMFIRKEALQVDEGYNNGSCYLDEIDCTYSAYKNGWKLIYDSGAVAFHLHHPTGGLRLKDRKKEMNAAYFKEKHGL